MTFIYIHSQCNDLKWEFCIPWNPTSSREAHMDVFIRSDLPLMCRSLFLHCCVLWGEQNCEGYEAPKWIISIQVGWSHYRWYQDHALAGSVGPTREDACARKGGRL